MVCDKFCYRNRHNLGYEKAVSEIGVYDNIPQQRYAAQKQARGKLSIISRQK
jgi:hypothetical protein